MEKMFRVPLKYGGYKYFVGENAESEANAYEVEMKQKEIEDKERQRREQEERAERVAKAEAERKAKEEAKEYRYSQVLDKIESLNKVIESYEKEIGEKLEYITVNGKLSVQKVNTYTNPYIQFYGTSTHDNWWNDLYKAIIQA